MKSLFLFSFLLSMSAVFGQETTFYDRDWREVKTIEKAAFYRNVFRDKKENIIGLKYYFVSGQIKYESDKGSFQQDSTMGKLRRWYANGQLHTDENRLNGKLTDTLKTYYENGAAKRIEIWKDAEFIKGECFDLQGKVISHTPYIVEPSYPNGKEDMHHFLSKELKHPKDYLRLRVEGEVHIQFTVLTDGSLANFHVLKATNEEFSKEALRVMKKMPKWSIGYLDGNREAWEYTLPIHFKIEEE